MILESTIVEILYLYYNTHIIIQNRGGFMAGKTKDAFVFDFPKITITILPANNISLFKKEGK